MDPAAFLPPAMFGVLLLFLFTGFPVAFSIGATALIFAVIGTQSGFFGWELMLALPERIFGIMSNFVLLAVVFFVFMGVLLEKSKLAEDLLETIGQVFGSLRGGLAFAVVFVGALLAAATGVVGASVVAMGLISYPTMEKTGYSKELSSGIIAASGTLGQIIPPSIVLIVLGDQLGVSVGDLFFGALLPGVMIAGMYAGWVVVLAIFRPGAVPALPMARRAENRKDLIKSVFFVLLPPLALIAVVLGSIFMGIATATEAGALGSAGAIILAIAKRSFNREILNATLQETTKLTCMVIFLLIGSTAFALVFRGIYGDFWVADLMSQMPGGAVGALIAANLLIFGLGFFIDFFEICFIVIPLIAPALAQYDINLVWFGVLIGINLQTSFLTPPFGPALFYLRGVLPDSVKTSQIYRGVIPFIAIQVIGLLLVVFFPELVLWAIKK